jgi:hypothetical protein
VPRGEGEESKKASWLGCKEEKERGKKKKREWARPK